MNNDYSRIKREEKETREMLVASQEAGQRRVEEMVKGLGEEVRRDVEEKQGGIEAFVRTLEAKINQEIVS